MELTFINILLLVVVIAIVLLFIAYRDTYFVKITWRYALILLPVVVVILIKLFSKKTKDQNADDGKFTIAIGQVKDKLQEANMVSAIEATAAREDNKLKLDSLKEAMAIQDGTERRKKLAELMD
jgi:uncharacterized protein YqhQ